MQSAVLALTFASLLPMQAISCAVIGQDASLTRPSPIPFLQIDLESDFEAILDLTYNFQFRSADSILSIARANNARNPNILLAAANLYWWKIIAGDKDPALRIKFLSDLENARSIIQAKSDSHQTYHDLFILINAYAFKARIALMDQHRIKGLMDLGECIRYIKRSLGQESKYEPLLLTSGLYNFFCEYGMKNNPILYPTLLWLPKGSMETGRKQLEKLSRSGKDWLSTEGHYFLAKIYLEIDKQPHQATPYVQWLTKRYPHNLIFQELLYRVTIGSGNLALARELLYQIRNQVSRNDQLSESQKTYFLNIHRKPDIK